jgi:hypothetical protein
MKMIGADLKWQRNGDGWRLMGGSRKFGDVVPDKKYSSM